MNLSPDHSDYWAKRGAIESVALQLFTVEQQTMVKRRRIDEPVRWTDMNELDRIEYRILAIRMLGEAPR